MKTTYTNKQLSEMIKSDKDAKNIQKKLVKTNKLIIGNAYFVFLGAPTWVIGLSDMPSIDKLNPYGMLIFLTYTLMLILSLRFLLKQNSPESNQSIIDATTSIVKSNRCSEVNMLLKEFPATRSIRDSAIAQGRQLYNFDLNLMYAEIDETPDTLKQKIESNSCKEVHGIQLA